MNRQTALVLLTFGLLCAAAPTVRAQHSAPPRPSYQVHIEPSTMPSGSTSIDTAPDTWIARGYDLKSLIAEIYAVDPRRIDLPNAAPTPTTYDVTLVLPREESEEQIELLLQNALKTKFSLTITPENRSTDVYVLSAPQGPGPALHSHRNGDTLSHDQNDQQQNQQKFVFRQQVCPGISSAGITATMGTIPEFSRTLEQYLDRPIVNEAALSGSYDFQIGEYRSQENLFQLLRDQLGLVVTPSRRSVEILAVRLQQPNSVQVGAL